ncbi:hypothetical protein ANANG_G00095260 [Anguilla anguilla]|uniref:Myozenin 2b n=1 Tax=Anguilla anguilla TaxID=7936 RepID=A0A9D3S2S4_ANGAN|nr:hypothetical protein ANANG_G00095260 [Anguilla anguilla]
MSRFSTLSARERKMQAAAICREVQGSNGDTMDLGKKLCTPKDIMLEELSLLSNRGSRLFKMRQRRSDKYTFESIQNEANVQLNNDVQAQNNGTAGEGNDAEAKTPPTPQIRGTPQTRNPSPQATGSP